VGFKRTIGPAGPRPDAEALTADLVAIGIKLRATAAKRAPNIEDTLLFASLDATEKDTSLLAPLVLWFRVHHPWVNADRLTRLVRDQDSSRVRALWAGFGRWQKSDPRFARLAKVHRGARVILGGDGREDPRFRQGPVRITASLTREREADVFDPAALAKRHSAYRWRLIIGPTYRADMWAALEADPELTPTELARRTYGSFATAWNVKRDFSCVEPI